MGSSIAGVCTLLGLGAWHLRNRRHPNWRWSRDGRFYITAGYPAFAIAVFWLAEATSGLDWEWAMGNLWAFAAMVLFVCGFNALDQPTPAQKSDERIVLRRPKPRERVQRNSARDITTR